MNPAPPGIRKAQAFQLGWLLIAVFSGQVHNFQSVKAQIRAYLSDLSLVFPGEFTTLIAGPVSWEAWQAILEDLAAQLAARNAPELVYFEAGHRLLLSAALGELASVQAGIAALDLPPDLAAPRSDTTQWLNQIHSYFNTLLRQQT